ncbi:MAG: hypothetical protein IJ072_01545 [Oscillospiraceae bacterium]|nr:hypothetical protein [Oscillospiraceae bacterium]
MELYAEILLKALHYNEVSVDIINKKEIDSFVEMKCYQTLKKIKAVIEDNSLEDKECFIRIEKIICELESIGSDGDAATIFNNSSYPLTAES